MATNTFLETLKINVLTKEQYDAATKNENELYMISDIIAGSDSDLDCGFFTDVNAVDGFDCGVF